MSRTPLSLLALLVLLLGQVGCAGSGGSRHALDRLLWDTPHFIRAHPDVHERKRGLWLLDKGEPAAASEAFTLAARHADKSSQAMLAEMHWEGLGVAKDRPRAYAWMDLAAERGYSLFVLKRESLWAALDPDERAEALRIGAELFAAFGDDVAKPRVEKLLDHSRRQITGSRVGYVGMLKVIAPTQVGWVSFSGHHYYHDRYWRPRQYFEWTDSLWQDLPRGMVVVGEPQPVAPATDG